MMTLGNGENSEYDELNPIEMTMIMKPNFRSVSSVFQISDLFPLHENQVWNLQLGLSVSNVLTDGEQI